MPEVFINQVSSHVLVRLDGQRIGAGGLTEELQMLLPMLLYMLL